MELDGHAVGTGEKGHRVGRQGRALRLRTFDLAGLARQLGPGGQVRDCGPPSPTEMAGPSAEPLTHSTSSSPFSALRDDGQDDAETGPARAHPAPWGQLVHAPVCRAGSRVESAWGDSPPGATAPSRRGWFGCMTFAQASGQRLNAQCARGSGLGARSWGCPRKGRREHSQARSSQGGGAHRRSERRGPPGAAPTDDVCPERARGRPLTTDPAPHKPDAQSPCCPQLCSESL